MPTRKIFDTIIVVWVLSEIAWGLPKLWAHRKSADPNSGTISNVIAGAIESVH
jgi:hypothetical protein